MTKLTESGTPWTLHLDRDGTEDFLVICDAEGHDIVRSSFFWQPYSEDDNLPATLTAVWLMFKAPRLLQALRVLAQQADEDCPAHARSCHFIEALEHANDVIAEATGRPPYISRWGSGVSADAKPVRQRDAGPRLKGDSIPSSD